MHKAISQEATAWAPSHPYRHPSAAPGRVPSGRFRRSVLSRRNPAGIGRCPLRTSCESSFRRRCLPGCLEHLPQGGGIARPGTTRQAIAHVLLLLHQPLHALRRRHPGSAAHARSCHVGHDAEVRSFQPRPPRGSGQPEPPVSSAWTRWEGALPEYRSTYSRMDKAAQCAALKVVGPHGLEPWTKGL